VQNFRVSNLVRSKQVGITTDNEHNLCNEYDIQNNFDIEIINSICEISRRTQEKFIY
jgi:hypothetical protein